MGQKKDIGTFFETKLNGGKKTPNQSLWEKINLSLDEETRRRKRTLLYWLVGGGLFVSLGLFLLLSNGNFSQTNLHTDQNNILLNDQSNSNSEEKNNKTAIEKETSGLSSEISKKDSLTVKNNDETLSKIESTKENLEKDELANSKKTKQSTKQISSGSKAKKDLSNKESIDETFSVTTKYYYYNNEDGKRIITTDKNEIDSLIIRKHQSLDSITTKKIDSLEQ
ncbi:hypothetical protein POV26_07165 [Aequorivita todarodis]|uniref:hypothetical protein n=1 Tax=Aequorivita todarodis TaxID=2036821 RepID=UPI002350CF03|nr:hypothetical protein [Aequorivita todarodis]MDC8000811.1 hypothetical protein [Aequorivita todarodis]